MEKVMALREKIILGILILLLIIGGGWRLLYLNRAAEPELMPLEQTEINDQVTEEPALISVHLVGAVNKPGVYHLPEGSRVYELLEMGGGFAENADKESLNQARPLFDGEQVYVNKHGSEIPVQASGAALININRATAKELTALPGIGEVRATQIVEFRESNGYFKAPEDLMDVSGIGQATYDALAGLITIY